MKLLALICWTMLTAAFATDAMACRASSDQRSMLFYDIPANVPATAVVLDVVFTQVDGFYNVATVRHVVRGTFDGDTIAIHRDIVSSCDVALHAGDQGFVIGEIITRADGNTAFEPVFERWRDRLARVGRIER